MTGTPVSGATAAVEQPAVVSLRASTNADREFLKAVFFSTRVDEFAASGLSVTEIDALLAQQFDMQDSYYRRHYPAARFDVVMSGDIPVGRLYHDWKRGRGLSVIDIALLPTFRGAGIGTRLMQALVERAAQAGLAVNLYVEVNNPVQSLYRRMDFVKCGENGIYESLRREAVPFGSTAEPLPGLQFSIAE